MQSVIVILLAIFAVVVTLVLIIQVSIQGNTYRPFADGTIVQFRSLISNRYLITDGALFGQGTANPNELSFEGSAEDPNTRWLLCQNQSPGNGGSYVMYPAIAGFSTRQAIGFQNRIGNNDSSLRLYDNQAACADAKQQKLSSTSKGRLNLFVNFILIEDGMGGSGSPTFDGKPSNVYRITTYDGRWFMIGAIPSINNSDVEVFQRSNTVTNISRFLLESSIVVEVVGTAT